MRFGLDGAEPLTLKQVAEELGMSRERIRQIVDECLTKLNEKLGEGRRSKSSIDEEECEPMRAPGEAG